MENDDSQSARSKRSDKSSNSKGSKGKTAQIIKRGNELRDTPNLKEDPIVVAKTYEDGTGSVKSKDDSYRKKKQSDAKGSDPVKPGKEDVVTIQGVPRKSILDGGQENRRRETKVAEPTQQRKIVVEDNDSDINKIFRVTNPEIIPITPKSTSTPEEDTPSTSSKRARKKQQAAPPPLLSPPPPPSSVEEEFYEIESLELENETYEDYSYLEYESTEEFADEEETVVQSKSRGSLLRERWDAISEQIAQSYYTPCRVFKLRGYHSEPDLSLPFENKFDPKIDHSGDGGGDLRKGKEKFVSCEDIPYFSGREHPDLVRGVLSEVILRSYAIDDNMKNSWWELHEWERKRYSFFDELFAMGYVVDSLEVLSQPPKGLDGKPITKEEYFVEAEEKHYRKKVDYGRVVFKTKHVYTGNFQDWYFEGPGRYYWQDGTIYQGEFSYGLMHGPGKIHWPDGCIYEGHFIHGKRTGWGVYSSADGQNTFAGEWLNGLPHGHGKMWYDPDDDDNDYYEGHWQFGLPQGTGTRQYSTGDRYVGNWIEGLRNGYGIMMWLQERQVYKGEWLDGVPHGLGKHIWYLERSSTNSFPTRHVYQGAWVMGRREGIGKMIYPCGSVYEGKWMNGQRHGKGMFINPAGDILVGLFRAGSILGGSDVPLHAPTYECDYVGLTEWLTVKFKLPLRTDNVEEERLLEITKQYLPYIRKLYHRAGEYSQKYGKHGLYPAYMKKGQYPSNSQANSKARESTSNIQHDYSYNVHHPREYSRLDEPEHMKGKLDKPESLDGVNPVTRFGLWLLLRDCDKVLDEVTMAYYDKMWCETPPLSFQTRHNPFEPVYLWQVHRLKSTGVVSQFLQALIVASVTYFIEIPRLRQHVAEQDQTVLEPAAVSDTALKSGVSVAEQRRAMIARQHRSLLQKYSQIPGDQQTVVTNKKSHNRKGKSPAAGGVRDDRTEKRQKKHGGDTHNKEQSNGIVNGEGDQSKKMSAVLIEKNKAVDSTNDPNTKKAGTGSRSSTPGAERRSTDKDSMGGKSRKKSSKKASKEKALSQQHVDEVNKSNLEAFSGEEDEMEEILGEDISDSHNVRKSVLFQGRPEGEADDNEALFPNSLSISECFEMFLFKKLVPCLKREPGANLPQMPQPLPALVDMYDAFKGIKQRDVIEGKEFFRSALPHLMFPSTKDALWWHRCPEPLSHQVNIDGLLEQFHQKFESAGDEFAPDENFDDKQESEYLGAQAQNSEVTIRLLKLCKDNPNASECHLRGTVMEGDHGTIMPIVSSENVLADLKGDESDDFAPLEDYLTDGNPFAEDELVPEPFLWADDYKCVPVRRKYQHFENINTNDVFKVIKNLYPRLCTGKHEKHLQFDLIFCDWLWCISLLAKTSTDREFRGAWKSKPERVFTSPDSVGVYAHYMRQIKNNPYLSPTPPPGFHPESRPRPHENEEKKAVKFL